MHYLLRCSRIGEVEDEIKLKELRMPIEEGLQYLCALEQLNLTPSEIRKPDGWAMCMMPPPTLESVFNKAYEGELSFKTTTPAQLRRNKRTGIKLAEMTTREYAAAREAVTLMKVPRAECIKIGIVMRGAEQMARNHGSVISLHDNWTKKTKQIKAKPIHKPVEEIRDQSASRKANISKIIKRIIRARAERSGHSEVNVLKF
jgi:ribosomal protein L14